MSERIIPLVDQRLQALHARVPDQAIVANGLLQDQIGRPMRDLRISVTDRCNFRCNYCMPKEVFDSNYTYLPHKDLLTFEEITRVARIAVAHGVKKIRLTGGEPLLRKNLEILIAQLAQLQTPDGHALDLTLTTNGSLLQRKAQLLKDAGLQRVTISLDGLDDEVFRQMNDVDFPVADVLQGIEAARNAGLGLDANGLHSGIKINMVVKRSTNTKEIFPMAEFFRGRGMVLRFIEYMDVGATNGWCMDEVLPSSEVLNLLKSTFQLVPLQPLVEGETAERWGYANDKGEHDPQLGEIGLISSVTQAFCGDCNRARLSTEGKIYLCLFATQGYDLHALLRSDASDADIASAMGWLWQQRADRYSQLRGQNLAPAQSDGARRIEMSYIGG
ncbi:MAG: GTP 3',8-cyclase MoaA [Limnohabitans sp.]|nr:GTP 3',8-cyclase MoaA [Limnohabitans sp.]